MKSYCTYLFLWACLLTLQQANAQNSQLRAYTIEDGLPQSQVYDMLQDEKGYLWLGTRGGGLASFDGTAFEVWNENDGVLSNYISALHDQNDTLFVGSKGGLSLKVKNNFTNFESPEIYQFYPTAKGLYLATARGLYVYSSQYKLQKVSVHAEIDTRAINAILYDGSYYWLATNKNLWKLSELHDEASQIHKIETNNFTAVLQHKDKILAATFDDGIFVIDTKNTKDNFLIPEPIRINSMAIHHTNELWVATDNDGITVIETDDYTEIKRLNTSNGLAVQHIRKSIDDRQSNLWIATSGGGFYKYFQNNFKHYDRRKGLKGNRIYAVEATANGVWFSSSEAGLSKIDSSGIQHIRSEQKYSGVKIRTIAGDTDGNIWAGSDDRGILFRETKMVDSLVVEVDGNFQIHIDTVAKQVTQNHIIDASKGFPSDWIRKIVVTDDAIWAATYWSGIVKFNYFSDTDSLVIRKTFGKREGITDLLIKDLVKDADGRLWYATQSGHLGYIENDKVIAVETPLKEQTTIATVLLNNGTIFLGTLGKGIWYADTSNLKNFKQLKGAKRLSSTNMYQLIFDNRGYLWAGTERGVDKIELNQVQEIIDVYHFGRNDGFLGIETCLNAVDKDANGNLWFGAIYGLTQYIPGDDTKITTKPTVYFTDVEEAYKSIDSLVLKAWTNSEKVLQLTPTQTQLSFSFRTVDLNHPNEIEYRSKLDDTDWSPWSTENKQNFAGLAYGAHAFSVQSRNHRWQESDPIKFRFFIDSPLYKKAWFQWTFIGLVLLLLITWSLFYIRRIKAKNKAVQERLKMQNHLLTLEQKALRLQMNPHFIFNVLNGIKAMASTKPEKMNSTINSFALLLRETLHNSRKETISLEQEIKTLRHYIEVEKLMAPKAFTYTIEEETTPSADEILIPPMLIQPFVENAIRHGILKGDRAGVLQIHFYTSKMYLYCTIVDNGMGIFKSQSEKRKTDHQSMALVVTRERLTSISGADALQIQELKNNDGTIDGTKITFKIPLLTDY